MDCSGASMLMKGDRIMLLAAIGAVVVIGLALFLAYLAFYS
jgi:hypothetical protein